MLQCSASLELRRVAAIHVYKKGIYENKRRESLTGGMRVLAWSEIDNMGWPDTPLFEHDRGIDNCSDAASWVLQYLDWCSPMNARANEHLGSAVRTNLVL